MFILSLFIALLIASFAAWITYRADKKKASAYPIITSSLRGLLIFVTILLIISPKIEVRETEIQKPIVLFIQDNSTSLNKALGLNAKPYQEKCNSLLKKLEKNYRLLTWNLEGTKKTDSIFNYALSTTNLTNAIYKATEIYGQQNLSAIILASDGWYNEGSNPLYADLPINSSFYSIALGDTSKAKDIRIGKIYANKTTSLNSQWEVSADILAIGCQGTKQNISLQDDQEKTISSFPIFINSNRFDDRVSFIVKTNKTGLLQFKISATTFENEKNPSNNNANVFVEVLESKKKILLLAAAPHPDVKAIMEAMKGLEQFEMVYQLNSDIPTNFNEYAAVILHQIPSNNLSIPLSAIQNKGVWFIAGSQSNYTSLNELQKAVRFGASIYPRSTEAKFNTSFSNFTLDQKTATISDQFPPLSVSTNELTAMANTQSLFLESAGKPLWAIHSSQKPVALLCGEGLWKWRLYEYKNTKQTSIVDECIRQTIQFLVADNRSKPFQTEMIKNVWTNPEHIQINGFLQNENNELVNQPDAKIKLKDIAGNETEYMFERFNNSYRIDLGALASGSYSYTAQTTFNQKLLVDQGKFVVTPNNIEDQELGCNYELMFALANKNQGATFTLGNMSKLYDSINNNKQIKSAYFEKVTKVDLINWKWLFFLILLIATIEWLLRKYWMTM
jgi:hypothetical protein